MNLKEEYPQARDFLMEAGQTAVLMVHGFTASPSQMRKLGGFLWQHGYTVRGMCLPGHGTTVEDMITRSWSDWLGATRTEALRLMERYPRVVVLGLSMGGVLTLLMAEELKLDGIIPIAAAVKLQNPGTPFSHVLRYIGPKILEKKRHPVVEDDVGYGVTPVAKVSDLAVLARMARNNLKAITCPMLVIQGKLDESVCASAPEIIMEGSVNCHDKELLWLENSRHVCTNDPDFDLLSGKILEFLGQIDQRQAAE